MTFGRKGFAPVAVELPRGRVVMVGSADKIDKARDIVLLVTDIKTGSASRFTVLNDDPVAAGTKLQLPVYAHAAVSFSEARMWKHSTGSSGRTAGTDSADLSGTRPTVSGGRWVWQTWRFLQPARTSLDLLEEALDAAGIAYRAESSSLVYQASEIRDLMAAARAVADPTDLLSTVTAPRSPVFGCGEDDLWTWRHARGPFNLLARPGESQPAGVVRDGLDYLRALHYRSRWVTPSELLATVVADRRMLEVAAADTGPRARDQWRRLRFARSLPAAAHASEPTGPGPCLVGHRARWPARVSGLGGPAGAGRVAGGGGGAAYPPPDGHKSFTPPEGCDAVRIMTIHTKGLQVPVVLLSGMSSVHHFATPTAR